jgi:hypothetical protein
VSDAHDVARDVAALLERHDAIASAEVTSYDEQDDSAIIAVQGVDCSFVLELRGVEPS